MSIAERYHIVDAVCGLVDTAAKQGDAFLKAQSHRHRHRNDGDDITVEVFDSMGPKRRKNVWNETGRVIGAVTNEDVR
jgi:hypothetical protein